MTTARAVRADALATADELLNAAERLFAREGVEPVALTQIAAACGQKNRSAVHYHFGSREGVVAAVLDRRLAHINALRHGLLDALPAAAPLSAVMRAAFAPLGLILIEQAWGPDYLSIVAQVNFHAQLLGDRVVAEANVSSLRRVRDRVEAALPDLPRPLIGHRLGWLTDSLVLALARWVRDTPPDQRTSGAMFALIDDLAAYGAAGLAAPAAIENTP